MMTAGPARIHFYVTAGADCPPQKRQLDSSYSTELWRPAWKRIRPAGVPVFPFGLWWLLNSAGFFANRDYGILIVRQGDALVHRSCVFAGDLRFPFMRKDDLQIGDVWTQPNYRGRGIAKRVLSTIVSLPQFRGRRFWYIVEESNLPSIRAAEDAGFTLFGRGKKRRRFGLSVLGYYSVETHDSPVPDPATSNRGL
jgi:RimJ/RimL family protein N-acetyltransferase